MSVQYKRIFEADKPLPKDVQPRSAAGDRRDGAVYVYNPDIELAVNVAIATARPLLVRGPSGSGKSSLAQNVALKLGWRYYEHVVSSVTEARDLLWRFDRVRQLADATGNKTYIANRYIQPGPLWWAFDRRTARLRGLDEPHDDVEPAVDPAGDKYKDERAVVLLDEIDKADPDVPNNLLVPLGSMQFSLTYPERTIKVPDGELPPLVVITTNEERELPAAFVRRCVVTSFDRPDKERLLEIAREHFPKADPGLCERIADFLFEVVDEKKRAGEAQPSTAEYLDAIAACDRLLSTRDMRQKSDIWKEIARVVLEKTHTTQEAGAK
ncbi:MAG TPA: MoxR family ATPase [Thermoanaerobaculia bacterium]|jgi:MoxR-like ATPase